MDYLLVSISIVCIVLSFGANKVFQIRIAKNISNLLFFSFCAQLFFAFLFLSISKFAIRITTFSLLLSIAAAVANSGFAILSVVAFKYGKMSIFTLFLMIGGMLLPYIFGIFFLEENITIFKIMGMVLLVGALIVNALFEIKKQPQAEKTKPIFWFICITAFVLNGSSSIITKIHATNAQSTSSICFLFLTAAFTSLIALIASIIVFLSQKKKSVEHIDINLKTSIFFIILSVVLGGLTGGSTLCNIEAAKTMSAVIEFPIITGGVTILTAVFALIAFKERITKPSLICLIVISVGMVLFIF